MLLQQKCVGLQDTGMPHDMLRLAWNLRQLRDGPASHGRHGICQDCYGCRGQCHKGQRARRCETPSGKQGAST
eukprot:CAMPEP_0206136288 /NCGR_PEP_ID=MMETSP1473-20131121/1531_1 /ASSEMBLY_ACC=CAM_ASM_001109 /TAXON_ID=1461547 /ORGANISM="Stichococcus sp, Strain RCC1054" /LENGTH=72 /DNA_ID=CAMNT_0053528711 /DNA_START=71 /DNA_END=285 /DNA_ORIENTATION=+